MSYTYVPLEVVSTSEHDGAVGAVMGLGVVQAVVLVEVRHYTAADLASSQPLWQVVKYGSHQGPCTDTIPCV